MHWFFRKLKVLRLLRRSGPTKQLLPEISEPSRFWHLWFPRTLPSWLCLPFPCFHKEASKWTCWCHQSIAPGSRFAQDPPGQFDHHHPSHPRLGEPIPAERFLPTPTHYLCTSSPLLPHQLNVLLRHTRLLVPKLCMDTMVLAWHSFDEVSTGTCMPECGYKNTIHIDPCYQCDFFLSTMYVMLLSGH